MLPTEKESGTFSKLTRKSLLTRADARLAASGAANRVDVDREDDTYACEERALEAGRRETNFKRLLLNRCQAEFNKANPKQVLAEQEDEDHKRFVGTKEDSKRTWAWNCSYYRRQIKVAKQTIDYAEARLGICQAKSKSGPEAA